jgi:photosystem II stability/assembly factor-like uncharacterized protein
MTVEVLLAATSDGVARAASEAAWSVEAALSGQRVHCLAADPLDGAVIYAGTDDGEVLRSADRGRTWERAGYPAGRPIRSLAVSPHEPGLLYAGVRPAAVFRSRDHGQTWDELRGFRRIRGRRLWFSPAGKPFTAYVHALALSPTDAGAMVAGIEFGAVVRSTDGGETWSSHRSGALRDCHSLCFHARDGAWVYEGGYGGGAVSRDGGDTWSSPREGMDRKYGWAVAADPARPEVWYVSAAPGPGKAHGSKPAEAFVFRKVGDAPWEKLGGGLPQPLDSMPYTLATHRDTPGCLVAGLANGEVWETEDLGESWSQLPVAFPANEKMLVLR